MRNAENSAIILEGLTKKYGNRTVLNNISLSIPKGLIFGLLGPNGAGKSSMINIISGLIQQTSGEVTIMGKNTKTHPTECKKIIGTAIQEVLLDPFFSVKDYLTFMAGYYGICKKDAEKRIEEVCTPLSLMEHLHKSTRMLSGGMKKRLIVAKALLHNPEIIILDEPTAGVDIELRASLWHYILELQKQGKTIILTTHYLEEAQSFCDNIAFINRGNIIANDTKQNILSKFHLKTASISLDKITEFKAPQNCNLKVIEAKNTIVVRYNPEEFELFQFISYLNNLGMKILDISTKEATLDDVFLSIFNK